MKPLALLLACAAALPAAAQAEQFRYRYRPGQVIEHRVNLAAASMMGPTGSMVKAQFRASSRQVQKVRSVKNGVVTLDITETPISGRILSGGRSQAFKQPPSRIVVRLTERGRFLGRTAAPGEEEEEADPLFDGLDAFYGLNFPARDLSPGDTWEDTLTVGVPGERRKVRAAWKYVGREQFRGRSCARVEATVTLATAESGAGGEDGSSGTREKLEARMTTYFDPAAGVEVYTSGFLVVSGRADLSGLDPKAGEFATVTKVNIIQALVPAARK